VSRLSARVALILTLLQHQPGGNGGLAPASLRVISRRKQIENGSVFSVRQAAAVCNVSHPVVRRWLSLGLLPEPPWTLEQLQQVRDVTDPERRRRGSRAAHGTMARWNAGCSCAVCAGERRATPPVHVAGPRPRSVYLLRCETGCWPLFMPGSRSGRYSVSSISPLTRSSGSQRPTKSGRRRWRPL
jgi:hypothetical protein